MAAADPRGGRLVRGSYGGETKEARDAADAGLVAGVVMPAEQAVAAFDAMAAGSPALRAEVHAAVAAMVGLGP